MASRLPTIVAQAESALADVRRLPPRGAFAAEMRSIRRAEIHASTALAGSALGPEDVDSLLDHDRAHGNHPFGDYLLVRAYADAARFAADVRSYAAGEARPLLLLDELRALNARATAGSGVRGGAWRQGNLLPDAGIVAPAAWLVVREITIVLDRFARGPRDSPTALWLARFFGRFGRILPFEGANGRTARLAANLMLRRLDAPPLVFDRRDRSRYRAALAAAETNDPAALAALIAGAIVRTGNRLGAAALSDDGLLEPLRRLAGADYGALAKAAQRGRLRTVVRSGRHFTTPQWIEEYRSTRSSEPDAPLRRPAS